MNLFSQIKHADLVANARNYLCMMGQLIGKRIAAEHQMTQQPTPGWIIYEWERLRNFWAFQLRLNGAHSCSLTDKKLANDLLDLHYLTFLPLVEAIATNDTRSIVPLAEAFGHADLMIIRPLAGKMKV